MIKVDYIQHWGNDLMAVNAARVSFGKQKDLLEAKDEKLIKYLAEHKHMTPFEHMGLTAKISCPLYTRSQIMRHRTFSYNEISRRYTDKNYEFYKPGIDDYRLQSKDNKQGSEGTLEATETMQCDVLMQDMIAKCHRAYERLIELGLCREQARGILPQCTMTEFYMSGNLRNWSHFLSLRLPKDAQKEVQIVAQGVDKLLIKHFPVCAKVLRDNL